jgi:hypothetical protein
MLNYEKDELEMDEAKTLRRTRVSSNGIEFIFPAGARFQVLQAKIINQYTEI